MRANALARSTEEGTTGDLAGASHKRRRGVIRVASIRSRRLATTLRTGSCWVRSRRTEREDGFVERKSVAW